MNMQETRSIVFGILVMCASNLQAGTCGGCTPCGNSTIANFQIGSCLTGCSDGCITNKGSGNSTDISHTYFNPRQITTNNVFQNSLSLYWWYHDVLCEDDCAWWALWVTPFYQRSANRQKTAAYFFPCNQSAISVKEDGTGNVGSLWLNLIGASGTFFDSDIAIRPQRSVVGAYINFRFDLSRFFCHSWLEVAFAPMRVKHELNFCEQNKVPGVACDLANVCEALNQPDWLYGRFNNSKLVRKGVDDVQFKFGYDWFYCDTDHVSPYFVGVAPAGKASCAVDVFEPTVGSNHGSVGFGIIGDICLWGCDASEITLLSDFKYRYVLRACETRSFDLCDNGDWSRYLQVVVEGEPSNSLPGINAFTQQLNITPGSTIDWWLALHYQKCQYNIELGYDLWWRQQEHVELCCFPQNIGIYDIAGDCSRNPQTAHRATICETVTGANAASSDATFIKITCNDINLHSAATPKALSNTLYASFGYDGDLCDCPVIIGLGTSYEFGRNSAALDNWALWLKMGMSF